MKERIHVPIQYVGEIGEASIIAEINSEPSPLQILSTEALNRNRFFRTLPPESQAIAIQALSILGAYTIPMCDKKWNSSRWGDVWEKLTSRAFPIVEIGIQETTLPTMRQGFKNLFQMLEIGVDSMELLERQKALGRLAQFAVRGRTSHTRQSPMGPASAQDR